MPEKKHRKLKINTQGKCYSIKDSALYNIFRKDRLAEVLEITKEDFKKLSDDQNYRVFSIEQGKKERLIQAPKYKLDKVHTRVASLIQRIEVPDFIHGGIKGKSHISNAKVHIGNHPVLTMDLKSFFPSVTKTSIYYLFNKEFSASEDVSGILANLCSYDNKLPTGSRLSMPLSYWCNRKMFRKIDDFCKSNNINFTLFVDDLTFSGESVDRFTAYKVKKIIQACGMKLHAEKTRLYAADKPKLITGVVVNGEKLNVRNKHHKAIFTAFAELDNFQSEEEFKKAQSKLIGMLSAAGQISEIYLERAKTYRANSL